MTREEVKDVTAKVAFRVPGKIDVLLEARPWIEKFRGKIFVLKYGGEVLLKKKNMTNIAEDVALLRVLDIYPVLVCGGQIQLDRELDRRGIEYTKKRGVRVYTEPILEVAQDVFPGITNKLISQLEKFKTLNLKKINREHIRVKKIPDAGRAGNVTSIDVDLPDIIKYGFVPILELFGHDEDDGGLCNINADIMAAFVANNLAAEKLILHTAQAGVLDEEGKVISHLSASKAERLAKAGVITGGMLLKVLYCLQSQRVRKIHIIPGDVEHALLYEVFTKRGIGTEIVIS